MLIQAMFGRGHMMQLSDIRAAGLALCCGVMLTIAIGCSTANKPASVEGSQPAAATPEPTAAATPEPAAATTTNSPLTDLDIYRMGLQTENRGVVQACMTALTAYPEGYHELHNFILQNPSNENSLFAVQRLRAFEMRPGYLDDLVALYLVTDPTTVGGTHLQTIYRLRAQLVSQLVPYDPQRFGPVYINELPTYLQAANYRIGFNDKTVSDHFALLDEKGVLNDAHRKQLTPHFIRTYENAFHSSEHEEAMRVLVLLTGLEAQPFDRRDKEKTLQPFRDWLRQ